MLKSRKRFGQHFLVDQYTLARIHDELAIRPDHRVIEIGPGHGELTTGILRATSHVAAIELDRDLTKNLRVRYPQLEVIQADVLSVDVSVFRAKRVVGNLPYNISTQFLLRLATTIECLDVHVMLQKEVVDRLVAAPGTKSWGRLSVKIQRQFDIVSLFEVPPRAFKPPPRVLSAFIRLTHKVNPRTAQNPEAFDEILKSAFSQRRKTIANSLASFAVDWSRAQVNPTSRADQLTVENYINIANVVSRDK